MTIAEAIESAFLAGARSAEEAVTAVEAEHGEWWLREQAAGAWRDYARRLAYDRERQLRTSVRVPQVVVGDAIPAPVPNQRVPRFDDSGRMIPGAWDSVPFEQMTAEQHRAVANEYKKKGRSLLASAKRHERAADRIDAAGVSCLAELELAVAS